MSLSLSFNVLRGIIIVAAIMIIAAIIIIASNIIALNSNKLDNLETKISLTQFITLIALTVTLFAGVTAYIFRLQLNELQKNQEKQREISIAKALATAEEAKLKQKQIEQDNIKLNLELERLRFATRYRILPSDKIPAALDTLSKYHNKSISILYQSNDPESSSYAYQIYDLFKSSGWHSEIGSEVTVSTNRMFQGISIVSDKDNYWCANSIAEIFEHMKLLVHTDTSPQKDNTIRISVGQNELIVPITK
jgi:hypothetical protein